MRDVTPAVDDALQSDNVPCLVLAELNFDSGSVYVTNNGYNVEWNGHTFLGVGRLGTIEPVEEGAALETFGATLTLSGIPTDIIAIALGEHYQGRNAKIWFAPLDEDYSILADPVLVFNGRMDQMPIKIGEGTSTIRLTVESRLADWERPRVRRYNAADQENEYPGDRGFEFVEQMVEKSLLWGRA